MTTQVAQLIGARVMGGDGQVVGTIRQIFNDDKDGTPVWARIQSGTRELFIPLRGSRVTKDGVSVPFDTRQIMSSPDVGVKEHMSMAQTDQLNRHFGLTVPAQGGPPDADLARGQAQQDAARVGEDWLIRAEERLDVGTELHESGRARLHKYVDVEPVEQTVHVFHEEYEIERVPISAEEQVRGEIAEAEQEIALHEERPVLHKSAVPVERVRLKVKRVDEDRTLRDEIRRERLEVEDGGNGGHTPPPAGPARPDQMRS
jgi:uncharacterized protein (TIGR02271 family)